MECMDGAVIRKKEAAWAKERAEWARTMSEALAGSDGSSSPGFFLVPWHDDADEEELVKKETKATIRCFPFAEQHRVEGKTCFKTGRPATHMAIFARAF